ATSQQRLMPTDQAGRAPNPAEPMRIGQTDPAPNSRSGRMRHRNQAARGPTDLVPAQRPAKDQIRLVRRSRTMGPRSHALELAGADPSRAAAPQRIPRVLTFPERGSSRVLTRSGRVRAATLLRDRTGRDVVASTRLIVFLRRLTPPADVIVLAPAVHRA